VHSAHCNMACMFMCFVVISCQCERRRQFAAVMMPYAHQQTEVLSSCRQTLAWSAL
jgi:hypothetical protein